MESSKSYNRNAPASTKLSKPLALSTVPPQKHLQPELCQRQHAGALPPRSAHDGQNRKVPQLRPQPLGRSAESPQPAWQESEQQPRHDGQGSERLLRNRRE